MAGTTDRTGRRRTPAVAAGLLALAGALLLAPATSRAAGSQKGTSASGDDPSLWRQATGYEVRHSADPTWSAQVYQSRDFRQLLVFPDEGLDAWVLDLGPRKVYLVTATEIGLTETKARPPSLKNRKPVGDLRQREAELTFDAGDATVTLLPGEPLTGEVSLGLVLKRRPDYAAAAAHYKPDPAAVAILKNRKTPAEIWVFFGTWCSTCKRYLPTFIRTMELAGNPAIKVRYVAIDPDQKEPKALIDRFAVKKTPTFAVMVAGKEIGRSAGAPKLALEREQVNILAKAP